MISVGAIKIIGFNLHLCTVISQRVGVASRRNCYSYVKLILEASYFS